MFLGLPRKDAVVALGCITADLEVIHMEDKAGQINDLGPLNNFCGNLAVGP